MSGICGWLDPNPGGSSSADIAAMAATLARFDASPVRTKTAPWGAVALAAREANGDLCQDGERLVVVSGRARISDARLADLARRDGLARAIAAGYAERGEQILKLMPSSTTGVFPARIRSSLVLSMSTPVTRWPSRARQASDTAPT